MWWRKAAVDASCQKGWRCRLWLCCCGGRWLSSTLLPSSGLARLRGKHWYAVWPCLWSCSLRGWSRSGWLARRLLLVDLGCGSSSCTSLDRLHALCHITHGRLDCRVHALDVFP